MNEFENIRNSINLFIMLVFILLNIFNSYFYLQKINCVQSILVWSLTLDFLKPIIIPHKHLIKKTLTYLSKMFNIYVKHV